jgi:probable F420-dependent oxidoreductase
MDRQRLGRLGVWSFIDGLAPDDAIDLARRIEGWGYGALWLPEAVGRDPFAQIAALLARTERLIFATGIANVYARDPMTMNAVRKTLADYGGGRFVLGLGVSHAPMVTGLRGHEYGKPVTSMRNYLDAMEKSVYQGHAPAEDAPIVLAALRKNMLGLARDRAFGAHPYFVPPEHTARAREILGPDRLLAPEQKLILETDPAKARASARKAMGIYLGLPNYRNNLLWLGFEEGDFEGGGSDRLVDAIVAWGDEEALRRRVQEHWDAGADHVCIQPLAADGVTPDLRILEALAPGTEA